MMLDGVVVDVVVALGRLACEPLLLRLAARTHSGDQNSGRSRSSNNGRTAIHRDMVIVTKIFTLFLLVRLLSSVQ